MRTAALRRVRCVELPDRPCTDPGSPVALHRSAVSAFPCPPNEDTPDGRSSRIVEGVLVAALGHPKDASKALRTREIYYSADCGKPPSASHATVGGPNSSCVRPLMDRVLSPNRGRHVSHARQCAFAAIQKLWKFSFVSLKWGVCV